MEDALKEDPKVKAANARINEYLAKTLEKEDRKRAKKTHAQTTDAADGSGANTTGGSSSSTSKHVSAVGSTSRGTTTTDGGNGASSAQTSTGVTDVSKNAKRATENETSQNDHSKLSEKRLVRARTKRC